MKESNKQNIKITLMLIFLAFFICIGIKLWLTMNQVNGVIEIYKERIK